MADSAATILLVDDAGIISDSLRSSLEKNGYHLLLAASGRKGLDILQCVCPDLIIVSLDSTQPDRLDILTRIHTTVSTVPVVVMPRADDPDGLIQALRQGACDVLPTVLQNESGLLRIVARFLERHRPGSPPADYDQRLERLLADRTAELAAVCSKLDRCQADLLKSRIEIRQVQNLESIGTLTGGIAHNLNNILSPILCFTELSLMGVANGKDIEKYLGEILNAGLRARELVKQISEMSHQEEMEQHPIELTPLIKETLKFLRSSLPETIEIDFAADTEEPIVVASPAQIHQILMNFCTNAAHAMKDSGGKLSVTLESTAVTAENSRQYGGASPGDYISLGVEDTGHGITPEIIQRIFEPAFTTKPKGEGTGMGMSVVREIAQDLGGSVAVTSEPGRGACFKALFPRHQRPAVDAAELATLSASGRGKILLVDDDKVLIATGREMLKQFGYEVAAADGSLEALEIFKDRPFDFDLVMTDLSMPKMTGLELSEKLLAIRPDIPIVLCTGFSHQIKRETIEKMGIRALVMKPVILREMAEAIQKALQPGVAG